MLASSTWHRPCGNGTNFDWLKKSCDISTCDLSPDGNPEKYGRPMKSAITFVNDNKYMVNVLKFRNTKKYLFFCCS